MQRPRKVYAEVGKAPPGRDAGIGRGLSGRPSIQAEASATEVPLKHSALSNKTTLPALASAANSPRKLTKINTMLGPSQLSAAERVKLRQQAAAMGVVERLKQKKAWGSGAALERVAQQHLHSGSSDTIQAVRAGGRAALPPITGAAACAPSPTACFSYESRRSSGGHHLSSSPSFMTGLEDVVASSGAALSRSSSPPLGAEELAGTWEVCLLAAAHAPPLQEASGLLHIASPSRRTSRVHSAAQLDETDLPLAPLAAASRRQTQHADGYVGQAAMGELSGAGIAAFAVNAATQQHEWQQAGTSEPAASCGGKSGVCDVVSVTQRLEPADRKHPNNMDCCVPALDAGLLLQGAAASTTQRAESGDSDTDLAAKDEAGTAPAASVLPASSLLEANVGDAADRNPSSEAQSSGRGILEMLAARKGLQKASRPSSRELHEHLLERGDQTYTQSVPATAPPTGAAAAAAAALPSGLQSQLRVPSRIQSLLCQRQRSRLSVDGYTDGSPGRDHPLVHMSPLGPAAAGQPGGDTDALATFEQAARQLRRATAADVPYDAARLWRRGTPTSASPSSTTAAVGAHMSYPCPQQDSSSCSGFTIPRCPSGRVLQIVIHSTWGDLHYVGLAAVECFDAAGQPVGISDPMIQVTADPESINVLPEYGSDPRTPDKLVDGVCMTCDDHHVWLAPFTPGAAHIVSITFDTAITLGMLRIWNYNKNRIHSLRGARHVEITLDGSPIFSGELQQAPGNVAEALQCAETILFTDGPAALDRIEQYDAKYAAALLEASSQASPQQQHDSSSSSKGSWAQAAANELDLVTGTQSPRVHMPLELHLPSAAAHHAASPLSRTVTGGRPLTAANTMAALAATQQQQQWDRALSGDGASTSGRCGSAGPLLRCRQLLLVVVDTYGDSHFVGLSGLEVLGADGTALPLASSSLWADPPDLNVFPGHSGDVRTIDKLLDGENNTLDDTHMWLAPIKRQLGNFKSKPAHASTVAPGLLPESLKQYNVVGITLGQEPVSILGLRVWNYNKNLADTARGMKRCIVLADGVEVSPPGGILLRKAPGTAALDFGQLIPLTTLWQQSHSTHTLPGSPVASRRHSSMAGGGRLSPQPGRPGAGGAPTAVTVWDETTAWICNMPNPILAAEYLHRTGAWRRNNNLHQPTESFSTPLPCGFALKLVILTSWGDPFYVGLCGIEIHDAARGLLPTDPSQLLAVPASVALLQGMGTDMRTPDKLVDGENGGSAMHSWLAPLTPEEGNVVYITYDEPVLLGAIRVWNYAKTPSRGVQELEVYLDDQLIYKGVLQKAPDVAAPGADFSQTLCFCEEAVQADMRKRVAQAKLGGQLVDSVADWVNHDYVVLVNDGQFVRAASGGSGRAGEKGPAVMRPVTAAVQ